MKSLRPLMIAGTGSDVGKSLIAAGLCRIFRNDGFRPAPFKAQNMALNSAATPDGLEIGRAQAVQAEACGIVPEADMNPLLLKPSGEKMSQIVLLGKPIGNRNALDFYRSGERERIKTEIHSAYDRLASKYNPIVLEGAGSIAELNLADTDLVNMSMARYADADIILIADIDRGGVFASAYGSIMLQKPDDRERIKGIIVNKFRGDIRLFEQGKLLLEQICGVPVIGVVPYSRDFHIDEEDSVALESKASAPALAGGLINVGIPRIPCISNFTDLSALERDGRFHVFYTDKPEVLAESDMIILPGSKASIADLGFIRYKGLDKVIVTAASNGNPVIGICGGYQMMGREIRDPEGIEGCEKLAPGLGLLPVVTMLVREKTTRPVSFTFLPGGVEECRGYEIHHGTSEVSGGRAVALLSDGSYDGAMSSPCVFGTYLHGLLDNRGVRDYLVSLVPDKAINLTDSKGSEDDDELEKLAAHLRSHLNIDLIYNILSRDDD